MQHGLKRVRNLDFWDVPLLYEVGRGSSLGRLTVPPQHLPSFCCRRMSRWKEHVLQVRELLPPSWRWSPGKEPGLGLPEAGAALPRPRPGADAGTSCLPSLSGSLPL